MPKIIITDERHSHKVGVGANGRIKEIPVGKEVDVHDDLIEALRLSSIAFSLVEDEPGGAAEGGHTEASPAAPGLLDLSVEKLEAEIEAVADPEAVRQLIAAEEAGKTRKGALEVLKGRLNALLGQ